MKMDRHFVIKAGMIVFLVVYIARLCLVDYAKDVPMDKIAEKMETQSSITELSEESRRELRRFYQIDDGETDGFFFYKAASPMAVEEVLIVKARSRGEREAFLSQVTGHLEAQKKVFEGYGTDQMALLTQAVTEAKGNYVYYMCGKDTDRWKQCLLSVIG